MIFLGIQDMVAGAGGLLDGVHAGLQAGDEDLSLGVGGAVQVMGPIFDPGDAEGTPASREPSALSLMRCREGSGELVKTN